VHLGGAGGSQRTSGLGRERCLARGDRPRNPPEHRCGRGGRSAWRIAPGAAARRRLDRQRGRFLAAEPADLAAGGDPPADDRPPAAPSRRALTL
ncbi:MAG: hypothetical protein AVDCRST_MAG31-727, partial [uncultured Sphingomonas sp.]